MVGKKVLIAAKEYGNHRLAAAVCQSQHLIHHAQVRQLGHKNDHLCIGIFFHPADTGLHGDTADLGIQIPSAGADNIGNTQAALFNDAANFLGAGTGSTHNTDGAAADDGACSQRHAANEGNAGIGAHDQLSQGLTQQLQFQFLLQRNIVAENEQIHSLRQSLFGFCGGIFSGQGYLAKIIGIFLGVDFVDIAVIFIIVYILAVNDILRQLQCRVVAALVLCRDGDHQIVAGNGFRNGIAQHLQHVLIGAGSHLCFSIFNALHGGYTLRNTHQTDGVHIAVLLHNYFFHISHLIGSGGGHSWLHRLD